MAGPRFQFALLIALVALVLCAGLVPAPASASQQSADDGTITTVLRPGYNLVAWLGPQAPTEDIFDQITNLERISTWDGEEQDYRRRTATSSPDDGLKRLDSGSGLFLYVVGDAPVEWTRPASEDSMLLDLYAGRNLVGWAGRDRTSIEEAVGRFGDTLTHAWLWDAELQRYLHYYPAGPEDAHPLHELNHGDALWVELNADARWWQSGTAPMPVEILGEYTEAERFIIRGWAEGNRGFFAERWGVEAPVTTYAGDRESVTLVYRRLLGRSGGLPSCGYYSVPANAIFLADDCVNGGTHAHEYFHAIQFHLTGSPQQAVPAWIREGSATYAQIMYGGTTYRRRLYPEHPPKWLTVEARIEERREQDASLGYGYWPSLSETEGGPDVTGPFPTGVYYDLGFLGIAWLAEHVGDQSVVDFYRHLADKPNWREAFEPAFGMTSSEFHEQFDAYRAATTQHLPHRTDGSPDPALKFLADIPQETQDAVRTEFDRVQTFLRQRFGAGATDYTVYFVQGRGGAATAHMQVFGTESNGVFCEKAWDGIATIIRIGCQVSDPTFSLARLHFQAAQAITAGVRIERGPQWLYEGAEPYVEAKYLDAAGYKDFDSLRRSELARAESSALALRSLAGPGEFRGSAFRSAEALSFVAVEWLLEHAGDRALFNYYGLLVETARWQDAFKTAFGITPDDFYEEFEAYRAEVAPPAS